MTSRPKCTAIIPTYNRQALLQRMLETLTKQTLDRSAFEVIVVDDGSSDNSKQVVEEFANELDIRYFYRARDGFGVSAARNIGIREARSEICVLVDSGLLLHPRCLEAHLSGHCGSEPRALIGYVYCFGEMDDYGLQQASRAIESGDVAILIEEFRRNDQWPDYRDPVVYRKLGDELSEYPAPWAIFFGCNVSAPTQQLRAIGGFDETFRSWGTEDVELGYRLYRNGVRFALNRDAAAIHIPHPSNLHANYRSLLSNSQYMAMKFRTPITALLPYIHTPHINEFVLRNRIERCEDFIQRIGRSPLTGIRPEHPDPDQRRLLKEIGARHTSPAQKAATPLLIEPDDWGRLRNLFLPEWNHFAYTTPPGWGTGLAGTPRE